MVLAGLSWSEKTIPWLLARFRDIERPEHAPRSPAGTQTYTVVYRRASCVLRSRERENGPTAGREKVADVRKK